MIHVWIYIYIYLYTYDFIIFSFYHWIWLTWTIVTLIIFPLWSIKNNAWVYDAVVQISPYWSSSLLVTLLRCDLSWWWSISKSALLTGTTSRSRIFLSNSKLGGYNAWRWIFLIMDPKIFNSCCVSVINRYEALQVWDLNSAPLYKKSIFGNRHGWGVLYSLFS